MNIKIPNRLCDKMGDELAAECKNVYKKFENFANKDMYFFPEYTDHSYDHIQYVLETANNLIPNDTLGILTRNDVFVLCLSILYHDLGMHITFNSIQTLYHENCLDNMRKISFVDSWDMFVEKNKIVNDKNKIIKINEITEREFEKYRGACSGFVREYHPIIAEIIARNGFPVRFCEDSEEHYKFEEYNEKGKDFYYKLSGIIARSHGENLRDMLEYLKSEYSDMWKTPYDCHVIYLMCIVRIADYLHITDDRINPYRLNLKEFISDKSKIEYLKHQSVEYSQRIYDNPETIYIEAEPQNCGIFIEMIDLLRDIQYELDSSWAVLGETYGLSELKLTIRRVRSNILTNEWQRKSAFVADKLHFHFDIRLVDLLIEPLYGNSASYGVRELIQNATDACKMKKVFLEFEDDYNPLVNITIVRDQVKMCNVFTIEDNGIGMSLDVIRNHFLNIGSKFKESLEWEKMLSNEEALLNGIEKNGKFGIGILSSYLLGNSLKITTCNMKEKIKYKFETKRDTPLIEISKEEGNEETGTKIEIVLHKDVDIDKLVIHEWYKNSDIAVVTNIEGKKSERKNLVNLESINDKGEQIFNVLNLTDYAFTKVYWSYEYKIDSMKLQGKADEKAEIYNPNLVCNGIIIPNRYDKKIKNTIVKNWPTIYVVDKNGKLDLNLSRDEVNGNIPFIKELEDVLMKKYVDEYKKFAAKKEYFEENKKMVLSQFEVDNYFPQTLMFGKNGYALFNKFFIEKICPQKIRRIWTTKKIMVSMQNIQNDNVFYIFEGVSSHPSLKNKIINFLENIPYSNGNIYIKKEEWIRYQSYSANIYRISEKFIYKHANKIKYFDDHNFLNIVQELNIDQGDVSLIVEYNKEYFENISDGSEIFTDYIMDDDCLMKYNPMI